MIYKNDFKFVQFILIVFFTMISNAQIISPFDVAFDLDWTLIYKTTEQEALKDPSNIIRFEGEIYRLAPGAIESIRELHRQPNVRVSYYSGGSTDRNLAVVKYIYQQLNSKGEQLRPYKVLNKENLVIIEGTQPTDSFPVRFKKELKNINPDLTRIVIVEDIRFFTSAGQEINLLWLGKTYLDFPTYADALARMNLAPAEDRKYFPQSEKAWRAERRKIRSAVGVIIAALKTNPENPIPVMQKRMAELNKTPLILPPYCGHLF